MQGDAGEMEGRCRGDAGEMEGRCRGGVTSAEQARPMPPQTSTMALEVSSRQGSRPRSQPHSSTKSGIEPLRIVWKATCPGGYGEMWGDVGEMHLPLRIVWKATCPG